MNSNIYTEAYLQIINNSNRINRIKSLIIENKNILTKRSLYLINKVLFKKNLLLEENITKDKLISLINSIDFNNIEQKNLKKIFNIINNSINEQSNKELFQLNYNLDQETSNLIICHNKRIEVKNILIDNNIEFNKLYNDLDPCKWIKI